MKIFDRMPLNFEKSFFSMGIRFKNSEIFGFFFTLIIKRVAELHVTGIEEGERHAR